MFEYFTGNYVWNIAVNLALEAGARIGEIDEMCRPLREIASRGDDEGTQAFFRAWIGTADRLCELADEDVARGRELSAGTKLNRAAIYYLTAERMQSHHFAPRAEAYRKGVQAFDRGRRLGRANYERVEIPYEGGVIAGIFVRAEGASSPAPVLVQVNGLDSFKELIYWVGVPGQLARRGVASLIIDQPGSGEALRLHGLTATYESERWASAVVDYLETRADVDSGRIGLHGVSLGGYFAPRAVAFEPRFALGAVWGANHNWGEVQKRRLAREGDRPVPHYWEHVRWVWGASDMDAFMATAEKITLDGVLDRIRVPFLVTHGQNDRQIPLEYAQRTYDQLVNSPKRELKIFTPREGGIEHSSLDNSSNSGDFIADWVAETFAAMR